MLSLAQMWIILSLKFQTYKFQTYNIRSRIPIVKGDMEGQWPTWCVSMEAVNTSLCVLSWELWQVPWSCPTQPSPSVTCLCRVCIRTTITGNIPLGRPLTSNHLYVSQMTWLNYAAPLFPWYHASPFKYPIVFANNMVFFGEKTTTFFILANGQLWLEKW